ncbi:MAG: NAD-dependent epimerase/dehydratase family protein [archaeon]|nr:NAD-dependent epimerase/dehydratase family protein [archaeon]
MTTESKIIQEDIKNIAEELAEFSPKINGKTFLIAGGAGFLGRYLILALDYLNKNILTQPCKIIVLDNFISGVPEAVTTNENVKLIQQDISKPFSIDGPIDYILHAASIASPIFYNKFRLETIDVGFLGTRNLLELAKEKNVKSFMFFSSSEVYGNPDPKFIPTNEEYLGNVSCIGPRACYDEPKRIGETLSMTYADIHNLPVKIIRPFNVFGPGMRLDDGRVVSNFVVAALKGEKIPIYGVGTHTRTFCYISDAITGIYKVLLSDHNREVFNIGTDNQEIQMRHLAEIVHGLIENDYSKLHNIEGPSEVYTYADPNRRCPDLTKIRNMVGYNPKVNLISGLKRFIAWAEEELAKQKSTFKFESQCRVCGNSNLKKIISLGKTPLANNLISEKELDKEELFPLDLLYCNKCHFCQLSYVVPPEKMFRHYVYLTSTTETFRRHFDEMAKKITKDFNLIPGSLIVDIGSNDGLLLNSFKNFGMKIVGVEPAINIASEANRIGIETLNEFFNENTVVSILKQKGKAKLITANNVFAHINDIKSVTHNVKNLLDENGIFCIEVQYLLDTIKNLTFDNIYHEHLSYFSVLSLKEFFTRQEMEIFKVEHVDTHGGSIRVFIQKKGGNQAIDNSVFDFLQKERLFGLDKEETYNRFAEQVYGIRTKLQGFIKNLKQTGNKIVGYGAPAKATTLLNFCGLDNTYFDYIIEDNKLKHGLMIPGVRIPIYGKEMLDKETPNYIAILAWNFADEILKNNGHYKLNGTKFFIPVPEPRII